MQKRAVCYPTSGFELSNRPFWTGMGSGTRVLKDLRSAHSHFRARPKLSLHSRANLWNRLKWKMKTEPYCRYFCQVKSRAKKPVQDNLGFVYEKKSSDNATVLFGSKGPLLLLWSRHESLRKVQAREISTVKMSSVEKQRMQEMQFLQLNLGAWLDNRCRRIVLFRSF